MYGENEIQEITEGSLEILPDPPRHPGWWTDGCSDVGRERKEGVERDDVEGTKKEARHKGRRCPETYTGYGPTRRKRRKGSLYRVGCEETEGLNG